MTEKDSYDNPQMFMMPEFTDDFQQKVIRFRNEGTENNCFLNVVVQNIWHLPAFKNMIMLVIKS